MSEPKRRTYSIAQELRQLGGFTDFTFTEATLEDIQRGAERLSSAVYRREADGAMFGITHRDAFGKKPGTISVSVYDVKEYKDCHDSPTAPMIAWKDTTKLTDYDMAGKIIEFRTEMETYWRAAFAEKQRRIDRHAGACTLADRIAASGNGQAHYYAYGDHRGTDARCSGPNWSIKYITSPTGAINLDLSNISVEETIAIVTMLTSRRARRKEQTT